MLMKREPDRIIHVSGYVFRLYTVHDEATDNDILNYPNFQENPAYTADGRPFVLSMQEGCPHGKPYSPDDLHPYDCSECAFFYLEAHADPVGLCMCEGLRQNQKPESELKGERK